MSDAITWHDRARFGSIHYRVLDDDTAIAVYPMTFGKARVCLLDREIIEDAFCYEDPKRAIERERYETGTR